MVVHSSLERLVIILKEKNNYRSPTKLKASNWGLLILIFPGDEILCTLRVNFVFFVLLRILGHEEHNEVQWTLSFI